MTPQEIIDAKLKTVAQRAGMIDVADLAIADLSTVRIAADGVTVQGADEALAALKAAKPFLFRKHVRDMSPQEAAAQLAELKRGPKPEPVETTKQHVREMSEVERQQYLAEHRRRFG